MPTGDEIHRLQRRQYGCVTRIQALRAGLTRHEVDGLVNRGRWRRAERGVYQHAAYDVTWHSRLFAVCASLDAVASHRSAGVLWELDGCRPGRIEVTIPSTRRARRPDVVVHRTTQWDLVAPTRRDQIPVTGLGRTILDLAAVVSPTALREAVNSARRRELIDWSELARVLLVGGRRGRNGTAGLRAFLDAYAGEQTLSRSEWSDIVADLLVDSGLPRPVLEHRVEDRATGFVAEIDLAYPDRRIGIELDSVTFHFNHRSFVDDRRRRNHLENLGWSVRNFTWRDCLDDPDNLVVAIVRDALAARPRPAARNLVG